MPGSWTLLWVILVAQVINTLMSLWLPTLNAEIINNGVIPGDIPLIWRLGAVMLAVSLLQCLAMVLAGVLSSMISTRIARDLRQDVCEKVLGFGAVEIRDFSPASLITRATNDVNTIQGVIHMTFMVMIQSPIMGVGAVIMAVSMDASLSLVFAVSVPVLILVVALFMRVMAPLFKIQQEKIDAVAARIRTALTGSRIVRAFGRKDYMEARFAASNKELKGVALHIGNLFALMMPVISIIINFSSVAVVWFGALRYQSGDMEIGNIIAFLSYLMMLLGAVMMASMMFISVPRAEVSAKRIHEVLTTVPAVKSPDTPVAIGSGSVTVAFEDVSLQFSGADRPLLRGVNLVLRPGTTTAIIGSTGSGKTTLLGLLMRALDPTGGRIVANGVDLRELSLDEWHTRLSVVPQNSYLFSGTIASTVSGLEPEQLTAAVRGRVAEALAAAQATEFVGKLADGMDTEVKAGGKNYSGGQRQRLAVARALYRRTPLLVLDDPFSALDFATEASLRGVLQENSAGVTQVLVAQRVASVRHADQIVVLDDGKVAGLGTHAELLENCQAYQEIVESQLALEEAK